MWGRRKADLVEARALSPSVRSLLFRTADGSAVGHRSGQYLNLIVPTSRGLPFRRPYSVASAPDPTRPDVFEIAVTRIDGGPTSEALQALTPGARIEIEGPEGTFVRPPEDRAYPALFVATGTGLAPIRAMLAEEITTTVGPPLVLLFGCRTTADVLWREELLRWQADNPRFRLHLTLSRPPPEWTARVGYVQRHVGELASRMPDVRAYVCGIGAMVDDVVTFLERQAHLARKNLRFETYD